MSFEIGSKVEGSPQQIWDLHFYEEAVQNALQDCTDVHIVKIRIDMGSSTGDNYLGFIYRIKVFYKTNLEQSHVNHINIIVKCLSASEANQFVHECHMYQKEKHFYKDLLPLMEWTSLSKEKFGAKLYHTQMLPLKTLVFEDLGDGAFANASRHQGFNFEQSVMVLKKLARFHALSMVLHDKNPDTMKPFHSHLINAKAMLETGVPFNYFRTQLLIMTSIVNEWAGFEDIVRKLQVFNENLYYNMLRITTEKLADDIAVLNHGDIWVNNIMLKYNDQQEIEDMRFVDYQMANWGSLGFDLNYFFFTSVQLDVLKSCQSLLLQAYCDEMRSELKAQSYENVPTYEQIEKNFHNRASFGFYASFVILPMVALDSDAASDSTIDNLADPELAPLKIKEMYSSPRVLKTLQYGLKRFDELGVFD